MQCIHYGSRSGAHSSTSGSDCRESLSMAKGEKVFFIGKFCSRGRFLPSVSSTPTSTFPTVLSLGLWRWFFPTFIKINVFCVGWQSLFENRDSVDGSFVHHRNRLRYSGSHARDEMPHTFSWLQPVCIYSLHSLVHRNANFFAKQVSWSREKQSSGHCWKNWRDRQCSTATSGEFCEQNILWGV